jgi:hypothetical protein
MLMVSDNNQDWLLQSNLLQLMLNMTNIKLDLATKIVYLTWKLEEMVLKAFGKILRKTSDKITNT